MCRPRAPNPKNRRPSASRPPFSRGAPPWSPDSSTLGRGGHSHPHVPLLNRRAQRGPSSVPLTSARPPRVVGRAGGQLARCWGGRGRSGRSRGDSVAAGIHAGRSRLGGGVPLGCPPLARWGGGATPCFPPPLGHPPIGACWWTIQYWQSYPHSIELVTAAKSRMTSPRRGGAHRATTGARAPQSSVVQGCSHQRHIRQGIQPNMTQHIHVAGSNEEMTHFGTLGSGGESASKGATTNRLSGPAVTPSESQNLISDRLETGARLGFPVPKEGLGWGLETPTGPFCSGEIWRSGHSLAAR